MSRNNAAKTDETNATAQSGTETPQTLTLEEIQKQLDEAKALIAQQAQIIEQQSAVIQQNVSIFDKLKESTAGETAVGKSVIEINERMKEKVPVFYPSNPFDPDKTHIKVTNPITGKVDSVAVGEWVDVPRAVANILERSAKADKVTMMLQKKGEADFEQKVTEAKE